MKTTSKGIAILLLLAGLIMVTIITSFIPGQVDMTAENIYTLSDGSKALLKKIEEPVTLDYYFRRSAEEVPIRFKNFATRVEALLRQYESAGGGNIVVNIIDPKPDTEEEEEAIRSGISSQPLPSGENFFFGLKAIQAEQEKIIPIFDLQRESFLEYDISRTIHRVQQLDLPKLGVVSSLPVISGYQPGMMPPGQPPPEDWVFIQELRESFSIKQVAADGNNLPDDLDVLAIIHPAGLSDPLLYEIDQFALSGKPVFIAVDPSSNIQKRSMSQQQMMMGGMPSTSSDLPRLFDKWGIDYDPTYFVADLQYAESVVAGPGGSRVRYPAWLNIDKLSGEAPPTAELNRMFLVEPGSFNLREDSGLTLTPLLESSDQSGLLTASLLNFTPPDALARQVDPNGETHVLAGILHGKLTTAFPDGRPAVEAGDEEEAEDESKGGEFLSESIGESTLVLIADSDFWPTTSACGASISSACEGCSPSTTTSLLSAMSWNTWPERRPHFPAGQRNSGAALSSGAGPRNDCPAKIQRGVRGLAVRTLRGAGKTAPTAGRTRRPASLGGGFGSSPTDRGLPGRRSR